MPYVQVWVDPEPCDDCAAQRECRRLEGVIDEAAQLLRRGEFDAALHALTDDTAIPVKRPGEIALAYDLWRKGRLPGFANYVAQEQKVGSE